MTDTHARVSHPFINSRYNTPPPHPHHHHYPSPWFRYEQVSHVTITGKQKPEPWVLKLETRHAACCCFSPAQSGTQRSHSSSSGTMLRRGPALLPRTRFARHVRDPAGLRHLLSAPAPRLLRAGKTHCVLRCRRPGRASWDNSRKGRRRLTEKLLVWRLQSKSIKTSGISNNSNDSAHKAV